MEFIFSEQHSRFSSITGATSCNHVANFISATSRQGNYVISLWLFCKKIFAIKAFVVLFFCQNFYWHFFISLPNNFTNKSSLFSISFSAGRSIKSFFIPIFPFGSGIAFKYVFFIFYSFYEKFFSTFYRVSPIKTSFISPKTWVTFSKKIRFFIFGIPAAYKRFIICNRSIFSTYLTLFYLHLSVLDNLLIKSTGDQSSGI